MVDPNVIIATCLAAVLLALLSSVLKALETALEARGWDMAARVVGVIRASLPADVPTALGRARGKKD